MSEFLSTAQAALQERFTDAELSHRVKFEILNQGALAILGSDVVITDEDNAEFDCILTAEADVFEAILSGEKSGQGAFMSGELQIEGNMGAAMELAAALG